MKNKLMMSMLGHRPVERHSVRDREENGLRNDDSREDVTKDGKMALTSNRM